MKTLFLSQKMILSKNSGQSEDFWDVLPCPLGETGFRFSNVTLCTRKCLTSCVRPVCLSTRTNLAPYLLFWKEQEAAHVIRCCDSEDSDWLARLYPPPSLLQVWHSYNGARRRIYVGWCKWQLFSKRCCVHDVIIENGRGEISLSVNTRLCVNIA